MFEADHLCHITPHPPVGRTQSAISQQIAKLENLIEKKLIIRGRELSLTSDSINVWNEPVEWVVKKELLPTLSDTVVIPLVLSPTPCVYRGNVIESLNAHHLKWRLAFSSPSYAGKMAAVRAGLGITAIQRSMIPHYLDRLNDYFLPPLKDIHVSLIKKENTNKAMVLWSFLSWIN